jgi:hypothetical protein
MIDNPPPVNQSAYMKFKDATDQLFDGVSHQDLASSLGVSVASIRQARLNPTAKAYREPQKDWEGAVIQLAEKRVWHYRKLIERLRNRGNNER